MHSSASTTQLRSRSKTHTILPTGPKTTQPFDFLIKSRIGSAKFQVYLIIDKSDKKQYALKSFPYTKDGIDIHYRRESRFFKFSHPHVCKIFHTIPERMAVHNSGLKRHSFLVMEYAPYGDFYELFRQKNAFLSEKLARTYFRQLIEGLEYLHGKGIAHLDIKCENLLIGEGFKLKITDFDLSQYLHDRRIESRGTTCYRAPEVMNESCVNFAKADVYAAGVVLFVLRSGGIPPHLEQDSYQGVNLYKLLYEDKERFWEVQESFQETGKFYSESFKKLFHMMVEEDPGKRATIEKIKKSEWYNEPVLTLDQLKTEMKYFYMR